VKGEAVAAMKAQGMEYQQRMEELDKLEYPKPRRDFVYETFNAFADRHPWVGQENIRPKSIAREMFENFRSFGDYVKDYELQRSEGLLLRHLNSVYKVLGQTVPDGAKTDAVREMELYLGTMIRQVDSSLIEEWEKMRNPAWQARSEPAEVRPPGAEEADKDITRDVKRFTGAIRNRVFAFLRDAVAGELEAALEGLGVEATAEGEEAWTVERLDRAMEEYHREHQRFCLDPEARNVRHTYVLPAEDRRTWRVQQMLVDPDGHNDWVAEFEVDLAASKERSEPVLKLRRVGALVTAGGSGA
jgi:hypothetical protein